MVALLAAAFFLWLVFPGSIACNPVTLRPSTPRHRHESCERTPGPKAFLGPALVGHTWTCQKHAPSLRQAVLGGTRRACVLPAKLCSSTMRPCSALVELVANGLIIYSSCQMCLQGRRNASRMPHLLVAYICMDILCMESTERRIRSSAQY